jgi:hypothetical protein
VLGTHSLLQDGLRLAQTPDEDHRMADGIIVPIGQPGADTVGLFTQLMQPDGPLGPLAKALGELPARHQKETQLQRLPSLQQQVRSIKPMLLMVLGEKACAVQLGKLDSRRKAAQEAGAAAVLAGAITEAAMQQQLAPQRLDLCAH